MTLRNDQAAAALAGNTTAQADAGSRNAASPLPIMKCRGPDSASAYTGIPPYQKYRFQTWRVPWGEPAQRSHAAIRSLNRHSSTLRCRSLWDFFGLGHQEPLRAGVSIDLTDGRQVAFAVGNKIDPDGCGCRAMEGLRPSCR